MDILRSKHRQPQSTAYQEPQIIKQGVFTCAQELLDLNIIDFHRVDSWEGGAREALNSVASWFIGRAAYTVMRYDLRQAPVRDDWPNWEHTGDHVHYGRLFWNDFHWRRLGTLTFGDRPDFSGTMHFPNLKKTVQFWGDIGKVSAGAFSRAQKNMRAHDLWISVCNHRQQVVIETLTDIATLFHKRNEKVWKRAAFALQKEQAAPQMAVPTLWD